MEKLHSVMATSIKEERNTFWLSIARLERLWVKCLAQEPGQVQYFGGFYVLAQMISYLFSLHRFSQLVEGFSHEQEANVTPQFKQWQLVFGRGDEQTSSINKWTDVRYQHTDLQSLDWKRRGLRRGAPVGAKSTSSLLARCQLHQSDFPESFTWKFLVSTSFMLPDGKHAWVFIRVTLYFSQLQRASLYNIQLSQHRALMNRDSLYGTAFFSLWI